LDIEFSVMNFDKRFLFGVQGEKVSVDA